MEFDLLCLGNITSLSSGLQTEGTWVSGSQSWHPLCPGVRTTAPLLALTWRHQEKISGANRKRSRPSFYRLRVIFRL